MNRMAGLVMAFGGALLASGCLHMESAHRVYLSPRGEVSWTVQQTDVRSDAAQAGARHEEEGRWLAGIEDGSHGVAVAFQSLGARQVESRLMRQVRPYSLLMTAEFGRVDALATRILAELQVEGSATLERRGGATTLTIHLQPPDDEQEYEGPLTALVAELAEYRIVLTEGRFVAADGFTISADGAIATPVEPTGTTGIVRLSLTWAGD